MQLLRGVEHPGWGDVNPKKHSSSPRKTMDYYDVCVDFIVLSSWEILLFLFRRRNARQAYDTGTQQRRLYDGYIALPARRRTAWGGDHTTSRPRRRTLGGPGGVIIPPPGLGQGAEPAPEPAERNLQSNGFHVFQLFSYRMDCFYEHIRDILALRLPHQRQVHGRSPPRQAAHAARAARASPRRSRPAQAGS